MRSMYYVYEDGHDELIGLAPDYESIIDGLIESQWLHEKVEIVDENDNLFLLKEKLGKNWLDKIRLWNIEKFNTFFDGVLWIIKMNI